MACTRAAAETMPDSDALFGLYSPPVLVADEPDPARPDDWCIHAYFDREPTGEELRRLATIATGDPTVERLGEDDWVSMSQAGLEPIRAGRFFVHTPTYRDQVPRGLTPFEIDAGLAFGTGQHATTAGCLRALDELEIAGRRFANIADIGTGTGVLAFAALALWPQARVVASDIDPTAIQVSLDNATINRVPLGPGIGALQLLVAGGLESPLLAARAPFDLIVANILAGPLVDLAPDFAAAAAHGATLVLAGLLDSQADAVIAAYAAQGMRSVSRCAGEWCVLVMEA